VADIKALRAKLNESEHAREELELEVEQMKACGSQQERHIESLEEAVSNNLGEKQALSGSIQLSAEDPKELASHAALGTIRALEEEISQLKEENAALKLDKDEVDQGL
jgi:FtsZ-binding cell division protein ZapB